MVRPFRPLRARSAHELEPVDSGSKAPAGETFAVTVSERDLLEGDRKAMARDFMSAYRRAFAGET